MTIPERLVTLRDRVGRFVESPAGKRTIRWARRIFLVAVLGYLVIELTAVGWRTIWNSLPTEPTFYLLFLALYISLPVAEVFMYRLAWSFGGIRSLPAFIKKRIYNKDVLGYSGEVFFFSWARRNVDLPEARILETIRDVNILSSGSSNLIALILLSVFLLVGEVRIQDLLGRDWSTYATAAAVVVILAVPLAIRFRRYLFSMPFGTAWRVFSLQCGRLVLGQVLQIAQWMVVMPQISMRVWFTFAALSIIVTRIPFVPNQNLIFLGAGVELSRALNVSTPAIAGMLLVTTALDRLLNLGLFAWISARERRQVRESERLAQSGRIRANPEDS